MGSVLDRVVSKNLLRKINSWQWVNQFVQYYNTKRETCITAYKPYKQAINSYSLNLQIFPGTLKTCFYVRDNMGWAQGHAWVGTIWEFDQILIRL